MCIRLTNEFYTPVIIISASKDGGAWAEVWGEKGYKTRVLVIYLYNIYMYRTEGIASFCMHARASTHTDTDIHVKGIVDKIRPEERDGSTNIIRILMQGPLT